MFWTSSLRNFCTLEGNVCCYVKENDNCWREKLWFFWNGALSKMFHRSKSTKQFKFNSLKWLLHNTIRCRVECYFQFGNDLNILCNGSIAEEGWILLSEASRNNLRELDTLLIFSFWTEKSHSEPYSLSRQPHHIIASNPNLRSDIP